MLPEGDASIDGVRFEFKRFIDAESALQLVALMPDQQTLLGFDLHDVGLEMTIWGR